uniref:Uncharacterized protein n=1 Tax=viral metagenome TaxID=1070528 RepID=A0A6H2A2V5_9ZZZZ
MTSDTARKCDYQIEPCTTGDHCVCCDVFKQAVYPTVGIMGRMWLIEAKRRAGGFDEEGGN